MKFSRTKHRPPIFEELEPRLLFSADVAEVLAADAVEQNFEEEPAITVNLESGAEENEVIVDQPVEESGTANAHSTANEEPAVDEDVGNEERTAGQVDETEVEQADTSETSSGEVSIAADNASTPVEEVSGTVSSDTITIRELVLVNDNVYEYEQLVENLLQDGDGDHTIEVVILDNKQDGIEQVTETLQEYGNLDAIHLITYGSEGQINLGSSLLDSDSMEENTSTIQNWGDALNEDGDILFYGCNIASGSEGEGLLDDIAELTGADIAGSTDLTGNTD